jgi:hypothetical protein
LTRSPELTRNKEDGRIKEQECGRGQESQIRNLNRRDRERDQGSNRE